MSGHFCRDKKVGVGDKKVRDILFNLCYRKVRDILFNLCYRIGYNDESRCDGVSSHYFFECKSHESHGSFFVNSFY